jgi:anti-sigma factor RsiW
VTAAHLDHDALADLAEGILDEASATSAEAHLARCADCRNRAAEVAEVSRVLAEAPMPPMPADLMERLDAAIAAEAASNSSTRRYPRRLQVLAAAAAAVVAIGGGAMIARTFLGGDSSGTTASQPPVDEPTRLQQPKTEVQPMHPYSAVRSGTNYTKANVAAKVIALLAATPTRSMAAPAGALDGCVRRIGGGRSPLLVDSATYDGAPATIIALPGPSAHQADVWIAGPGCSPADPDVIFHVRIPR